MPKPTTFAEAVPVIVDLADKQYDLVHGDASTVVETDNGPVPSAAKAVADLNAEYAAQDVVDISTSARDVALSAASTASAIANRYPDTVTGLAAVAEGAYFSTPSTVSSEAAIVFRKVSGSAVESTRVPSSVAITKVQTSVDVSFPVRGAYAPQDGYTFQQVKYLLDGFVPLYLSSDGQALMGQLGSGMAFGRLQVMQDMLDKAGGNKSLFDDYNYEWALGDPVTGNVYMGVLNGVLRGMWEYTRTRTTGFRACILGDSINAANGMGLETSASNRTLGAIAVANAMAGWPLDILQNFAISGSTLQVIAGQVAPALALAPDFVFVDGGTNNIGLSDTAESIASMMAAIIDQILATGAAVIFQTIGPYAGSVTKIRRVNRLYRQIAAARQNVYLVDVMGAGVDPTQSALAWKTGYSYDGTHPTNRGGYYIAKAGYEQIIRQLCPVPRTLTCYLGEEYGQPANAESGLLNDSALMLTSSGGVATNWALAASGGATITCVPSIEPHPDGHGNVQVMTLTSTLPAGTPGEYRATYTPNMKDRGLVEGASFFVESWMEIDGATGSFLGAEVFGDAVYDTDTGSPKGQSVIGGEVLGTLVGAVSANTGPVGVPAQTYTWRSPVRTIAAGHAPDASTDYTLFQIRAKFNGPGTAVVKFGKTGYRKVVS